jgi:cell wall-associated NlpC family hydrolase
LVDTVSGKSEELIDRAMEVIGVRYRSDTELPQSGLDGSSFVGYVFKDKLGFLLPRKSTQMSRVGKPINRDELQPGDLVFFNTMRLTFSHVGIYVGDNKFIHSPSKGTTVRVDDLGSLYWDKRFDGARRLDGSDSLHDSERQELLNEVKKLKRKSRSL